MQHLIEMANSLYTRLGGARYRLLIKPFFNGDVCRHVCGISGKYLKVKLGQFNFLNQFFSYLAFRLFLFVSSEITPTHVSGQQEPIIRAIGGRSRPRCPPSWCGGGHGVDWSEVRLVVRLAVPGLPHAVLAIESGEAADQSTGRQHTPQTEE